VKDHPRRAHVLRKTGNTTKSVEVKAVYTYVIVKENESVSDT
jgi:hypothetical protein